MTHQADHRGDYSLCRRCGRRFTLPYGRPGYYDSLDHARTLNLVRANANRHARACRGGKEPTHATE